MSKLIHIFDRMCTSNKKIADAQEEALRQIKDLFLELIGEDELYPRATQKAELHEYWRNGIRAELRQKVNDL